MQYIQVVPKLKISLKEDFFTYKIPANLLSEIKIGQLVEIGFAGRTIKGIVYKIIRRASSKIDKTRIKNINRILYPEPIISKDTFTLANMISSNYLVSFSKALFSLVEMPILRKTKVKKQNINIKIPSSVFKKISELSKIISKISKAKKSALIILPEINLAKMYFKELSKKIQSKNIYLFHHELNKSQKWQIYQSALKGENIIVIGTQTASFLPISNLKLAIIEYCDLEGFKSDQAPKTDCRDYLIMLKKYKYFKLVFRGAGLPVRFFLEYKNKSFTFLSDDLKCKTFLLEKDYKNIFSDPLLAHINQSLKNKQKVFILINQKGYAKSLYCTDCENILECEKCKKPLSLIAQDTTYCINCNLKTKMPTACPVCRGTRLTAISYGISYYENVLANRFPKYNIKTMYKDHKNNNLENADIIIGTLKFFSVYFDPIGTSVYLNPENYVFQSDFKAREKTNLIISRLRTQSKKLILYFDAKFREQITEIVNNRHFILSELKERKKYLFPPYAKTIKIKNRFKTENIAIEKIKELKSNLKRYYPDISDPIPLSPYHNTKGYGYSIIINSNQRYHPKLENLKGWQIEVDL